MSRSPTHVTLPHPRKHFAHSKTSIEGQLFICSLIYSLIPSAHEFDHLLDSSRCARLWDMVETEEFLKNHFKFIYLF